MAPKIVQSSTEALRTAFLLRRIALFLCATALACAIGCGKRRPPLPPIERVPQRTEELSGSQRGNQITLSWPAPLRNAPESSVQSIRRIDVYRLAEPVDAPLPLTEEEFATRATLIGSVNYVDILQSGQTLHYTDTLELAGQPTRLRYAVRYVNAANQRASFSNFLLIEPAARIAAPPQLSEALLSENAVTLTWRPSAANIDGSTPVNLLGYNIYRREKDSPGAALSQLNSTLVNETMFVDKNFQYGQSYRYLVRAVSLGTGGQQVESLDSNELNLSPRDTFPPSSPASITIAAAPNRLSLFFPANPERDVVGYFIYRSTDPDLSKELWTKLNTEPLTRTTFQDEQVESGQKYYYYLTAVDNAGNTSAPSVVISETVP